MEEGDLEILKQVIVTAITECTDSDLLDLIYKILMYDIQ